jgi:hypothetical protein
MVARYLAVMNDSSPDRQDKFRRYRERKKAAGLREVRLWLPDVNATGFREEAERQAALLRGTGGEKEALEWTEGLRAESWKNLD